jgi:cytoskeletal protein RodZ
LEEFSVKTDYNRLLLIAVADAVIALILAVIVLVMILTSPGEPAAPVMTTPPAAALSQTPPPVSPSPSPSPSASPDVTDDPQIGTLIPPTQSDAPATTAPATTAPATSAPAATTAAPTVEPQQVPRLSVADGIDVTYLDRIETGKVTGDGVHVRAKPDSSGTSLETYDKGQAVQVYGTSGRWYLVKIGSVEGFMSKTYVTLD